MAAVSSKYSFQLSESQSLPVSSLSISSTKGKIVTVLLAALGLGIGGFWGLIGGAAAGCGISLMSGSCKKEKDFQTKLQEMVDQHHFSPSAKQEILKVQNSASFDHDIQSLINNKTITPGNGFFVLMAHKGRPSGFSQRLAQAVKEQDLLPGQAYYVLTAYRQFAGDPARFKARIGDLQFDGFLDSEAVRGILQNYMASQAAPSRSVLTNPRFHLAPGSAVLSFLDGGTDAKGRTYDGILEYDDKRLEEDHDWVQQIFPTFHKSQSRSYDADKWVVTDADAAAIQASPARKVRMQRAYARLLRFFKLDHLPVGKLPCWVTAGNHNFLRVTRILASLKMAGLDGKAQDFMGRLRALANLPGAPQVISGSFQFWERAANAPTSGT